MRYLLATTALALSASAAWALEVPQSCGQDPTVLCVPYRPNDVVKLTVSPDVATVIALHPGEAIISAPMVDDNKFQISPFGDEKFGKNNVMIRPNEAEVGRDPNLTIFTQTADNKQRLYVIDLVTSDQGAPKLLRYTYPEDAARAADGKKAKATSLAAARADDRVHSRLRTASYYGSGRSQINWAYECRCSKGSDIVPDAMNDNGESTVFRYDGTRAPPAFYTVAPDGHESPIVTTRIGNLYTAPVVSPVWRLRRDSEVVEIRNRGYHPNLAGWQTGTASGDVVREVVPTAPGESH